MVRILVLAGLCLALAGCSTVPTYVSYDRYDAYASDRAGNRTYKEVAPIRVTRRGHLWERCGQIAVRVMDEMKARKERARGDALVHVRWRDHRTAQMSTIPRCTQEWGWAALAGVGALGPWAQVAHAEALIVRFED
ncbi:hypothetical protein [Aquisalimonas asiatica]|uniref:Lipoprotein n=1 Tax=Aquisalimonas asiatica TaxID=406100 RepID=A0A1H8SSU2_9GAMM|nr:hypothetical protein [Aquisalimonas asiatica]SEO81428.1 hypothetical protein SAMN04488052_103162 [Aquisalimonas asiatica]